jgi:hypothetical protein
MIEHEGLILAKVRTMEKNLRPDARLYSLIIEVQKERRRLLGLYPATRISMEVGTDLRVKGYEMVSPDSWPGPVDPDMKSANSYNPRTDRKELPPVIEGVYESSE